MNIIFIKALLLCFIAGIALPYLISSDDWLLFGLGIVLGLGSIYYVIALMYDLIVKGDFK